MATVKTIFKQKTRKENDKWVKLDTGFIYVQYGHDGKTTLFSTGIELNIKEVNFSGDDLDQNNPVKRIIPGYTTKNSNIRKLKNDIDGIKDQLINKDEEPTIDQVKEFFEFKKGPKYSKKDFFQLYDEFLKSTSQTKAKGTIKQFNTCRMHLKNFEEHKGEKILLSKINLSFYDKFVNYLLSTGLANGSVGTNIKDFKVFLNYLRKRGEDIKADLAEFKVLREKPVIIYLTEEELEAIYAYDFSENKRLERVRDLFVLQCSTGLRFSDLSRLGPEHIQGNIIRITAHKTKKNIMVPLTPKAHDILTKYSEGLPEISDVKANAYIKEVCQIVGLNSKVEVPTYSGGKKTYEKFFKYELITTHVAVKTFITHCGEKNISPKVVSEITGKTVKVILDHYYGTNEKVIEMEMQRAFGVPETKLKIS